MPVAAVSEGVGAAEVEEGVLEVAEGRLVDEGVLDIGGED